MCQEEIIMELKAIIAIGLVLFIIGGLIFLKIRSRKKWQKPQGRPYGAAPLTYPKKNWKGA